MSCKEVLPSLLNLRWYNEKISTIKTVPNNLEEAIAMADDELKATAGKMLDAIERKPYPDHPIKLSTIREFKFIEESVKQPNSDLPTFGDKDTDMLIYGTAYTKRNYKKPKFKVGDSAQIMWKQRTSPGFMVL